MTRLVVLALILISVPVTVSAVSTGALVAGANTAVATGDNDGFETTPGNADNLNDNIYAVSANTGTGNATDGCATFNQSEDDAHDYHTYGFSIPAGSSIDGIQVNTTAKWSVNPGTNQLCVELSWDGGTSWTTTARTTGDIQTSESSDVLGGAADTWGHAWTVGEMSDTNFRLRVMIDPGASNTTTASLEILTVTVTYTPPTPPTVSTDPVTNLTTFSAKFNGTISNNGGADATEHGFAYGTDASLATAIATSTIGAFSGTGSFLEDHLDLQPSTTYYARAYATNSAGTGYGSIQSTATFDVIPSRTLRLISTKLIINEGGRMIIHQR